MSFCFIQLFVWPEVFFLSLISSRTVIRFLCCMMTLSWAGSMWGHLGGTRQLSTSVVPLFISIVTILPHFIMLNFAPVHSLLKTDHAYSSLLKT